jgi:mannose-1-phosphate guanylyltransferase
LPRGTASVVGLAAVALQQRDPEAVMAVLTSDHYIGNEEGFRRMLVAAHDAAADGHLVTLGITPTYPATGYGYVQRGQFIAEYRQHAAYQVLRFKEKPGDEQARSMLSDGQHAWNSGMFVWRVARVLDEFALQMPDLYAGLQEIRQSWQSPQGSLVLQRVWSGLKSETIDYGIMEAAQDVVVIMADDLQWNDVGSWDSLFDVLPADPRGNIVMGGKHIGVDTQQSLVYVNQEHRLIVTIGVEDLVVVDTGDVLLVCRKDQAQKVRQVVAQLKKSGLEYL